MLKNKVTKKITFPQRLLGVLTFPLWAGIIILFSALACLTALMVLIFKPEIEVGADENDRKENTEGSYRF